MFKIEQGQALTQRRKDDDEIRVDVYDEPPKLQQRRSFGCCFCCFVLAVGVSLLLIGVHHLNLENAAERRVFEQRVMRDGSLTDTLHFGIWERSSKMTRLQLQVALSIALSVRAEDEDVHVKQLQNSFFQVVVDHATREERDLVNSESFFETLNQEAALFGGECVLSERAILSKNKVT